MRTRSVLYSCLLLAAISCRSTSSSVRGGERVDRVDGKRSVSLSVDSGSIAVWLRATARAGRLDWRLVDAAGRELSKGSCSEGQTQRLSETFEGSERFDLEFVFDGFGGSYEYRMSSR